MLRMRGRPRCIVKVCPYASQSHIYGAPLSGFANTVCLIALLHNSVQNFKTCPAIRISAYVYTIQGIGRPEAYVALVWASCLDPWKALLVTASLKSLE